MSRKNGATARLQTNGGLVKTAVVISADQDRAIAALAIAAQTSRSAVIRRLIEIGLRVRKVGQRAADAAEEAFAS